MAPNTSLNDRNVISLSQGNNSDFDLSPIYGDSKWVMTALIFTTFCHMVVTPLFYGIIWYEVNSHIRTLINQLLALACWSSLVYATWTLLFTFARFFLGPLNNFICSLDIVVMNTIGICEMIFMDCIVITKYVFVHFLKNPVALDDELFKFLIAMTSGMLSFISQVVFVTIPGRNPLRFSVCVGKIPLRYISEKVPVKFNWPFYMMLLVSCAILAGIFMLRKFSKKKFIMEAPATASQERKS